MIPTGPIARATFRTSLVLGLRLLALAGTLLMLTQLLGPDGFGTFAALAALATLLGTLATFGSHLVLLRNLSQDPTGSTQTLHLALGTTGVFGIVLMALYVLLCFSWLRHTDADALTIICIGTAELLLQPFLSIASVQHHARGQIARAQLLVTSPQLLRLGIAGVIWLSDTIHPLRTYAVGHLLAVAVALSVALTLSPRQWPHPRHWRLLPWRQWREYSGYAFLGITASGPTELDKTLAASLLPLSSAGVYSASARVIGALVVPVIAMMLSALPRLFREGSKRNSYLLRWLFASATGYGLIAAIAIWWTAPQLEQLFGPKYVGIAENVRWLALAVPGMSLRFTSADILMTFGRPWERICIELGGLAMLVTLSYYLTSADRPIGIIIAAACTEWSLALAGWAVVLTHARRKA